MVKQQLITKGGPTLGTIRMVEQTLRDAPNSLTTLAELKRLLPKQVNHNALCEVLDFLQEQNRILVGTKGIAYIHNPDPRMEALVRSSWEVTWRDGRPEFIRYDPERFRKIQRRS